MSASDPPADVELACRRVVLRAVDCVDTNRPEALREVYTADAVLRRPGGEPLAGCDAIVESYRRRPADRLTRHLVTHTLVDLLSSVTARARSGVLVWSGTADPAAVPGRPVPGTQKVGEFDDHLVLTPQGWRIARREASFVFEPG